ncbi:hypothetical protein PT2222_40202 [Paraburkholderia tropica]
MPRAARARDPMDRLYASRRQTAAVCWSGVNFTFYPGGPNSF